MNIWMAAAILGAVLSTAGFVAWKIFYHSRIAKLQEEVRNAN